MKKGLCTWGSGCVSLRGCHGRLVIAKGSEKWKQWLMGMWWRRRRWRQDMDLMERGVVAVDYRVGRGNRRRRNQRYLLKLLSANDCAGQT